MTFAQTMEGQFHSEKEARMCGSSENMREMYEKKKETRKCLVNEIALCNSHTKLSKTVLLENWRICVAFHT